MDNRINQYGQASSGYNQSSNVQGGYSANTGQFQQNISGNRASSSSRSQGGTRQKLKSFWRQAENAISSPMNSMTNAFNPMAGLNQQAMFNPFGQAAPPPEPRMTPAFDQGVDQAFRNGRGDWNVVAHNLAQLANQNLHSPPDMRAREQWRALVQCVSGPDFPPALRGQVVTELTKSLPRALSDNSMRTGEVRLLNGVIDSLPPHERAQAYGVIVHNLALVSPQDQKAYMDDLADTPYALEHSDQKIALAQELAQVAKRNGVSPDAQVRAWVLSANLVKSIEPQTDIPKDVTGHRQGVNKLDDVVVDLVKNDAHIARLARQIPQAAFDGNDLHGQFSRQSMNMQEIVNTLHPSSTQKVIANLTTGIGDYDAPTQGHIYGNMLGELTHFDDNTKMSMLNNMVRNLGQFHAENIRQDMTLHLVPPMSRLMSSQIETPQQRENQTVVLKELATRMVPFVAISDQKAGMSWGQNAEYAGAKFRKIILDLEAKDPGKAQEVVKHMFEAGEHSIGHQNSEAFRQFCINLTSEGGVEEQPQPQAMTQAHQPDDAQGLTPAQFARKARRFPGEGKRMTDS